MISKLVCYIGRERRLHETLLHLWRFFPPRLAEFLKGVVGTKWIVGAIAVFIDYEASPPEIVLAEHSYRRKGAWGLVGGSIHPTPNEASNRDRKPDSEDIIKNTLRREIREELGLEVRIDRLLKIDATSYVMEEPGTNRLNFYYQCTPSIGFTTLRHRLASEEFRPISLEISQVRLVPSTMLRNYDLFSSDAQLLSDLLSSQESLSANSSLK